VTGLATIVAIGIGTYLLRLSFIAVVGQLTMPDWALVPLRYVAPAVFAAIITPAVFLPGGTFDVSPATNPRVLAALVALAVAWKTKNVVAVIMAGMGVVWLLQAIL